MIFHVIVRHLIIYIFSLVPAGVLQLLLGRQHSRVGLAQSDIGETVPRTHGRSVVHRHLFGRFETVDRWSGQHRPLLGPQRRPTATATRFLVTGTSLSHEIEPVLLFVYTIRIPYITAYLQVDLTLFF